MQSEASGAGNALSCGGRSGGRSGCSIGAGGPALRVALCLVVCCILGRQPRGSIEEGAMSNNTQPDARTDATVCDRPANTAHTGHPAVTWSGRMVLQSERARAEQQLAGCAWL